MDHGSVPREILSDITVYMKYARYLPEKQRRETWEELVTRNMEMHIKKFPTLEDEIREAYNFVYDKKVLPSMRSLQFGGKPIEISPSRGYNCCYAPVDDWRVFSEIMFLLLGGTGVGFSVQEHHIDKLPALKGVSPNKNRRFLVNDSIEGWADAIKILMKAYFFGRPNPVFDFSDIRAKGARLVTSGGKAPGPQPLRECIVKIRGILDQKSFGENLTSLECHDIVCYIADAVLAGGIRRAALISLFSANDNDMLSAKTGAWWELNPQRGRANNSAVMVRARADRDTFDKIFDMCKMSGAGEPGLYFTNDKDWGVNPCAEIALKPFQMCNLTEINAATVDSQEELNARTKAATFIGTLQASYTDFHYLRPIWQRTTEKDALLGVSMTGIATGRVLQLDLEASAKVAIEENERAANLIGINKSSRVTCVKPAGTTSLVLGTSSGIHAWHNDYYIRRIRVGKNEAIYTYLSFVHPELLEDCKFRPHDTAIIKVPQKAPEDAILRHESAMDLLNRIRDVTARWISAGFNKGMNSHNVSATVTVKEDEWEDVREWMWTNRHHYNCLSLLPFDVGTYTQAPFEDSNEDEYLSLVGTMRTIDLANVYEVEDNTELKEQAACAGGACEVT